MSRTRRPDARGAQSRGRLRRRHPGAAGDKPRRAGRQDRRAARRERRGQDDIATGRLRAARHPLRQDHQRLGQHRRRADSPAQPRPDRRARRQAVPGGTAHLRRTLGGREPAGRRARQPRTAPRKPEPGLRTLPGAAGTYQEHRGLSLGRRAADARHGPSADVRPALSAAGRAESRSGAAAGAADPRPDRGDQQTGHDRAVGRAERDHGAVHRGTRLRAGDRKDRDGQAGGRPARGLRHSRVLPRARRRGRGQVLPRRQALQATEAVVVVSTVRAEQSATAAPGEQDATAAAPILEFTDVHLFVAGVKAINGIAFEVGARELFAIIGPNGAGKTSIFNVLSGVYRPRSGRVRFNGVDLTGMPPHRIAALGLARTFQNIELFANLTVLDNLMLGRHTHIRYGVLSAFAWLGRARNQELANRAVVEDIVDFLELEQWREHPVRLLPYGVQKRVELGRALAAEPKLLLLDEPVAGMNLEETEDMARFILDIRDELDIPMIMVEHDMGIVMDLADRIMAVDFGVAIATGTPAEVQRHPDVIRAYLGEEQAP